MKNFMALLILTTTLLSLCTGCYRMPTENDFSVVPTTNNPAVTFEKPNTIMQPSGLNY